MSPVHSHLPHRPAAVLLTICLAICLNGCVAVPVPTAVADPDPFTEAKMTSIRIGHTTREDVRALFADWTYETDHGVQTVNLEPQVSEAGRYWTFNLRRQTGDIAWAGVALVPEAPVPVPFFLGKADNYEDFWVLFEFNDEATVARFLIASGNKPCMVVGACYHAGYLQLVAEATTSASATGAAPPRDRCDIHVYAEDDFELPISVTDGVHAGRLIAKTSFVRFAVPVGPATVSSWYDTIPGSAAPMPINCAGGEIHYIALRPEMGLIEAKLVKPSTGEGAIKKRHLLERLVAVHASVAPKSLATIWTNCTADDPCRDLAVLDTISDFFNGAFIGLSMSDNGEEQFKEAPNHKSTLLLRPGMYTWSSEVGSTYTEKREMRVDTFEIQAGHRYQTNRISVECSWLFSAFSDKVLRDQVCAESRNGSTDSGSVSTNWFEDVATRRVVAGQKWCSSDAECPESQCLKQAEQPRGICNIPELQCSYGESCIPR